MKKLLIPIIVILGLMMIVSLFILPFFNDATLAYGGFWDGHPKISLLLSLLFMPAAAFMVYLFHTFYEEENSGKCIVKYLMLYVSAVLLSQSVQLGMPALKFIGEPGNHTFPIVGWASAVLYYIALDILVLLPLLHIALEGVLDSDGWLRKIGSLLAGVVLLGAVFPLAWFTISNLWWIAVAAVGILMLIGFFSSDGPSRSYNSAGSGGSGQNKLGEKWQIYVDEVGNRYVSAHITAWDEGWRDCDTSRKYYFQGKAYYRLKR
jgi:hypothetical protein